MSAIVTPSALSEGMPYRAIPLRVRLVLWRFSHVSADRTSSCNAARFILRGMRVLRVACAGRQHPRRIGRYRLRTDPRYARSVVRQLGTALRYWILTLALA